MQTVASIRDIPPGCIQAAVQANGTVICYFPGDTLPPRPPDGPAPQPEGFVGPVRVIGTPNAGDVQTATGPNTAAWLPPPSAAASASTAGVGAGARRINGVMSHIGDSNTNGRPGWRLAYEAEWLGKGGIFEGWTSYNLGQNGSTLADWATNEVGFLDNPTYASLPPADYNVTNPGPGRLARAVNANPDFITVCLGTNDLNNPGARGAIGTEANLRANLAALVTALLARTKAGILLRTPQPFAYEDFLGVTQWANAAEAAEASRRLRQVYSEWRNVHPRVEVYESHSALFGNSCDDKTVNAQDPFGQGPMIEDSLHCTNLGYRRMAQQIARQLVPTYPRSPVPDVVPAAIAQDAVWAVSLWFRAGSPVASGTSATLDMDMSVVNAMAGASGTSGYSPNSSRNGPLLAGNERIRAASILGNLAAFRQLLAVPDKSKVFAYSWASGTTTQLTTYTSAQIVAGSPSYSQMTVQAASLAGFGGGLVTFYVTNPAALPFAPAKAVVVNTSIAATTKKFGVSSLPSTIGAGVAYRTPSGAAPVITVYLQNQADGRYVTGNETFASPGKPVGTFSFSGNSGRAALVFDATNYPGGSITIDGSNQLLHAAITTGTLSDLGGAADMYLTT